MLSRFGRVGLRGGGFAVFVDAPLLPVMVNRHRFWKLFRKDGRLSFLAGKSRPKWSIKIEGNGGSSSGRVCSS